MKLVKYILITVLFLTACNPAKYIYVREEFPPGVDSVFYKSHKTEYQLQPGDLIYMSIHSSLTDAESIFHFPSQKGVEGGTVNIGNSSSNGNMYLTQYVIDESGYIRFPVIGSIYAAGSTVVEMQDIVEKEARKFVIDALVKLKLVSFQVTFLGEFTRPGKVIFYKDQVNILEALGEAGEITVYADRKNIRVMRQSPDGILTYHINISDPNLMTSEKFYLQPNDIVYAEPLGRKIFRVNITDYALIITNITSTVAIIALIISMQQ